MKEKFIQDMTRLETILKAFTDAMSNMSEVGFCPEAEIFECYDKLTDFLILKLSDIYDIHHDVINWFVFENAFGASGYSSRWDGCDKVKITDADTFWNFEKSCPGDS